MDNATSGDTVFVYDDSSPYKELVVIDKSINLIGEDKNTTVIDGNYLKKDIVKISADSVVINGFTIQHSGENSNIIYGIRIISNNCIISDNIFKYNERGIISYTTNENIIQNNTFQNNSAGAILLRECSKNIIEFNNFFNDSITLAECHNNTISNNKIYSLSETGIEIFHDANDNNIIDNEVTGCIVAIEIGTVDICSDNIISGNYISDNIYGIVVGDWGGEFSKSNLIIDNIIINNGCGIDLEGCEFNIIKENNISNNDYGIIFNEWGGARENIITRNNIVSNEKYGIKFSSPRGFLLSHNNVISSNNLIDNTINAGDSISLGVLILGYKNYWDKNYYSNYRGGLLHLVPCVLMVYFSIPVPFFTIDWNPAREPYDIEI